MPTDGSDDLQYHLVVEIPMDNMSNDKPINAACTFSCEVIHASMPRKLGGNRACGRVFHLVQELDVRTVWHKPR